MTRACSTCGRQYQPKRKDQRFCRTACRDRKLGARRRVRRGTTTQRGYGAPHRRERERWRPVVEAGDATCCRCHKRIPPDAAWHLDHDDNDRTRYRGVACATCNTRAGAIKGNTSRAPGYSMPPRIA